MGSPALLGGQRIEAGAHYDVLLTGHASANTDGSYSEIFASTTFDASAIRVLFTRYNQYDFLVDIAIGGAGSEQIIITNMPFSRAGGSLRTGEAVEIPVPIPAGSRISARCQASTGSGLLGIAIDLIAGGAMFAAPTLGLVRTYGANATDSGGVSVDPGATPDTKGAYSEIASATTGKTRRVLVILGNQTNQARSTAQFRCDLAIGAASSEQIVWPDIHFATQANGHPAPTIHVFALDIPAGVRLAARGMSNISDATDRLFDVAVIGVG